MDTNDRRTVISWSTPSPQVAAPVKPEGPSALTWFTNPTFIFTYISFVAYVLCLSFELAFCNYFGIPYYLISLNPTVVLSTMLGTTLPFVYMLFFTLFPFFMIHPLVTLLYKNRKGLFLLMILFCVLGVLVFIDQELRKNTIAFVVSIIGIVFAVGLVIIKILYPNVDLPTSERKEEDGWWNEPLTKKNTTETLLPMASRVGVMVSLIVFLVALGGYGESFLGKYAAEHQEKFLVVAQPEEAVIIRSYGEYLFIVPFNRDTKQLKRTFTIMKMSEMTKTQLTWKNVGPLKPEPIETKP